MNIAFLLYPQVLTTGVSIPVEMIQAANQASGHLKGESLTVSFVAESVGPIEVSGGLQLNANQSFAESSDVDWIFVPPMWGAPWRVLQRKSSLHQWLREHYRRGSKIIATGTGVGHVAEAGLLGQRVSTTHWYYLEKFRKRYPNIDFQTDHFITHQDGIYCAGSINAQTDLVLFLIERNFGEEALALVERQFMHEIKRSFSTPYFEPGGHIHDDEVVSLVQSWIRSNFSEHITMAQLENVSGQSERQLRRKFVKATGGAPIQYLNRIRIEEAQSLLRETNLPIDDIAHSVGYSNAPYFARVFKSITDMTASQYRKMVRKKPFSDD